MASLLVSVIMPTYNRAHILRDAIESVLKQTYPHFELLIVDDGSTDATVELLKQIRDERVRVINASHGGAAAARNLGIQSAKGSYIGFCDSDDQWVPNKLELQINYFNEHPSLGLVYSDVMSLKDGHVELASYFKERKPYEGFVFSRLLESNFIPNVSVLVRKDFLDSIGYFNETLSTSEDYELWLRFCLKHPVGYVSEVLVKVFRHGNNITMDDQVTHANHLRVLDLMASQFRSLIPQTSLKRAYARTFRHMTYHHILNKRWSQAQDAILRSWHYDPFSIATYRYLLVLMLPGNILNGLLGFRKRLKVFSV